MEPGTSSTALTSPAQPLSSPAPAGQERRWIAWLRRLAAGFGVLLLLVINLDGMWLQALALLVLGMPFPAMVTRILHGVRRQLDWRLFVAPFSPGGSGRWAQWTLRGALWLLAGAVLWAALPAAHLIPEEYLAARALFLGMAVFLALLEAVQTLPRHRSGNVLFALALTLLMVEASGIQRVPTTEAMTIVPPFRGEWIVFHGGSSSLINHHHAIEAQSHALDLVIDMGRAPDQPEKLESYAAWGQPLYAPAAGRVVTVVGDLPDQPIGGSDTQRATGNHLVIDCGKARFVMLAHLKQGSVLVRKGDMVEAGQPIAECGNSGNTSEPHLHIQVQNGPDFSAPALRTYPILWDGAAITRAGKHLPVPAYLRRNDRISVKAP